MTRIISIFLELLNGIWIVISPLLVGSILGLIVYANVPNKLGISIGIILTTLGLIVGIIWALRVSKKEGTTEYMSNVYRSRDLDHIQETYKNKEG